MAADLDFTGKRVLVIGGSSGIGNGIAHGFRARGASVIVTGTRPDFGDYLDAEDADFTGLDYRQLNLTDRDAAARLAQDFGPLDVLVLSQGTVRYGRQEFTREGWDAVV
ncbi:MAG: 3-oxoacyl-ACP reductase, partial [Erythrobacter sp.]|nr:3-oxoacyl-ACP reductase [Erythrobacter sp.]